jgi:hypothetical protein
MRAGHQDAGIFGWKDEHGLAVLDEILANDTVPVSEED